MNEESLEPRPAAERRRKKAARLGWLLGGLVLAGIVATVFYVAFLGRRPVELELAKARIAVLPFAASSRPADAWLGWGLATIVSETLQQTSGLEVLPSERLRQLLAQRGIDLAAGGSREQARGLAIAAGAGLTVDGDFRRREDGLYDLHFSLVGAGGTVLKQAALSGGEPLELAGKLVESLASGMAPDLEAVKLQAVFGSDDYLTRLYGEGLQQLAATGPADRKAAAAGPYFEILLRNDPSFTRAKARLVDCRRDLGELAPARRLAEQLLQESLPRGELDLQVSTFRSLGLLDALEGDEVSAAEQFRLGHRAALARHDRAGELLLLGDLVRLALARGDRNRAEELLVEMVQVQKAQQDLLGEADSLLQIGSLYLTGGDLEGAAKVLEESQQLVAAAGDDWGVQRISASLGDIAWRRGEVAAAADHWVKALEFYRRQKDNQRILMMTRNLGEAQIRAGRYQQAEKLVVELRELAAEMGDRTSEGEACVSQAWLQLRLGFPFQAREPLDCALARDTNLSDRKRLRQVIAWLAYEQGEYELALRSWYEIKLGSGAAWSAEEQAFLEAFTQARATGHRAPLPGEQDYRSPP
jgi:tetratricopeptide (TPR) repeat protein